MESHIKSISSDSRNVRQEVFPLDQWTITTRKGKIMQSKCTCNQSAQPITGSSRSEDEFEKDELCNFCKHHNLLPHLNHMPDMLFNDNLLKLEHYTGVGLEFNALGALKCVEITEDPLRVAVADGWQSARSDFPFANRIVKPFDWTFTTDYRGSTLASVKKSSQPSSTYGNRTNPQSSDNRRIPVSSSSMDTHEVSSTSQINTQESNFDRLQFHVEETSERIDVNRLRARDEILFYDDVTLYEDELADHGTSQYSVKVRVMPKCLFILARFYLRIDGVLARINDTRIYHELNKKFLLREYTNREAKLNTLNHLPVSTVTNPNELMNHLPLVNHSYEKLTLPIIR